MFLACIGGILFKRKAELREIIRYHYEISAAIDGAHEHVPRKDIVREHEQAGANGYHRIRRSQSAEEHYGDDGGIADYAKGEDRVLDAWHYQKQCGKIDDGTDCAAGQGSQTTCLARFEFEEGDDVEDMGKREEEHLEYKGVEFLRIATGFERPGEVSQC